MRKKRWGARFSAYIEETLSKTQAITAFEDDSTDLTSAINREAV